MILGIDPKVDYAFKRLFGMDRNRDLLIDLINAVLDLPAGEQVAEVEILNPFNPQETSSDKLSIVDIKARDQQGRHFNVEMQMAATANLRRRLLYYWARIYQQQLGSGEDYHLLRPTYTICFVNDVLFPGAPGHHLQFGLIERRLEFEFTSDLALHTIELPKFKLAADEIGGPLDRWLYFLRHAPELDTLAVPIRLVAPTIQRAVEELAMVTQSEMEHARYETQRKAQMDAVSFANELKRAKEWEQRAGEMEQQLQERRRELESRDRELESRDRELESRDRELESRDRELESRDRELMRLNQEIKSQRERGELTGRVLAMRDLLGLAEPSEQTLVAASHDELKSMLADLQARAQNS